MKYWLIYENQSTQDVSFIDTFGSLEELYANIDRFNYLTSFKSPYKRITDFKTHYWVDFGSYFRFYYITWSQEEAHKLMEKLKEKYDETDVSK